MSPYKSFISSAKEYLNSNGFLKFLLSARIVVFALGGLFYLLGIFLINIRGAGAISVYDAFSCLGVVLMLAGLLLNFVAEDSMTIMIVSGSVSVASLVAWIVLLARSYPFLLTPLFYFLAFGAICLLMFLNAEYFVKMRAEAAARNEQMRAEAAARAMIPCPRCGAGMPNSAGFCPNCGAPNPAIQYAPPTYAPPAGQQPYAPPAGQYAPTTYQPYTPPAAPYAPTPTPYAPPAPPLYVPAEPAASVQAPEPAAPEEPVPPIASAEPEEPAPTAFVPGEPAAFVPPPVAVSAPAVKQCISCGAELPAGAVFCGKCGTKQ